MTQTEIQNRKVAFLMGYLSKEAEEPYTPNPNMNPAAQVGQQYQQHMTDLQNKGGVGGAIHNWANMPKEDQNKRAWGEGLGVAGLGAAAGYMAGGDTTSALLGGGIAALIYYVAQTFFGGDMQKGRQLISSKINNDTVESFTAQLISQNPDDPTLAKVDPKQVAAFGEIGKVDSAIKSETDSNQLAELHKRKAKAMENAGIPQILNTNVDANQDNIPDFQQYGTPGFQANAPEAPAPDPAAQYSQPPQPFKFDPAAPVAGIEGFDKSKLVPGATTAPLEFEAGQPLAKK